MKGKCYPRTAAGFTLVELLLSMVVSLIIVLVSVTVVSSLMRQWRRDAALAEIESQVRVVNDLLRQDCQALMSNGEGEFFRLKQQARSGDAPAPVTLLLLSRPLRADGKMGKVRAVAWALRQVTPFTENGPHWNLYRAEMEPDVTLEETVGLEDLDADFWADKEAEIVSPENLVASHVAEFFFHGSLEVGGVKSSWPEELELRGTQSAWELVSGGDEQDVIPLSMICQFSLLGWEGRRIVDTGEWPTPDEMVRFSTRHSQSLSSLLPPFAVP